MFYWEVSLLLRYKMKFGQNGVKKTCFILPYPSFCYICCRIITQFVKLEYGNLKGE